MPYLKVSLIDLFLEIIDLNIYTLFVSRCGIPVVIMGETGCGKTCLIRYMCGLQSGPGGPKNMLLMKV